MLIGATNYPNDLQYITSTAANDWGTVASTDANPWGRIVNFQFTWANPTSGQFPTYDGFDAQFKASIGTLQADRLDPKLKFEWFVPAATFDYPAGTTITGTEYDTKPTAFDEITVVVDTDTTTPSGGVWDNIAPLASEIG